MDMTVELRLQGAAPHILSVTLRDVLECIPEAGRKTWALLWLTAVGALLPESVLSFEQIVNESPQGVVITWSALSDLANRLEQVVDIILIGSQDTNNLHRYLEDTVMYEICDYVLELIDSSYWLLHSKDKEFIANVKNKLGGGERI